MRSTDHPGASKGNTMTAPKHAGRKVKPHRVIITKADNGGYTLEHQPKYADARDEFGDRPAPETHAFENFQGMHDALPEMFGEKHPSTAPKEAGTDDELPD